MIREHSGKWPFVKERKLTLLNDLTESRSFRNRNSFDRLSYEKLSKLFYAECVALVVVSYYDEMKAKKYSRKTTAFNNFDHFRTTVTDLYLLAHVLLGNSPSYKHQEELARKSFLSELDFKRFLAVVASSTSPAGFYELYFYGIERELRMKDGVLRNLRRSALQWETIAEDKRWDTIKRLKEYISRISPRSELLDYLDEINV